MAAISAVWTKAASAEQLQRSSHTVSAVGNSIYVFGGELKPREPRDNDIHKIDLTLGAQNEASVQSLSGSSASPTPRVGSATATLGGRMYMFSGRGGTAMAPIDEAGGMWSLDPASDSWTLIHPAGGEFPAARSYHTMTSDADDTVYVHAGCPESGRLSDLWAFYVSTRTWRKLADAPNPPRGGTSIAFTDGKLYRMNGFDGTKEQGGALDVYDPKENVWSTKPFPADGRSGPGARSVSSLLPVKVDKKKFLVTLFGESDPSSLGHMGAGKMLSDIWAYAIEDDRWSPIAADSSEQPRGRGWFDADAVEIGGKSAIAVVGGLGESNERLADLWVLSF